MASILVADSRQIDVYGKQRISFGQYANSTGGVGGTIETGLSQVYSVILQPSGSSVTSNQSVVNETFPTSDGIISIVTDANQFGTFFAIGI